MTDPAICAFPGCDRPTNPRVTGSRTTYCRRYYDMWRLGEELRPLRPFGAYSSLQVCTVDGCGRKHRAKGLCSGHHRMLMAGQPLRPATLTQQAATLHVLRLMCPDEAALLADCLGIETAA